MFSDPRIIGLVSVGVGLAVALLLRGLRLVPQGGSAPPRRTAGRIVAGSLGAASGIAFVTLVLMAIARPRIPNEPFDLPGEVIRYSALGSGVIFLGFLMAAAMPFALDGLERWSFVSFVGARHVRATKSGFLTVISVLSILGVSLSSCALCTVTSIMGGFGNDLKQKILSNTAHVMVEGTEFDGFGGWDDTLDAVRVGVGPLGGAATPVVTGDAMSSSATNTAGVLVRGIDPDTIGTVIDLKKNVDVGKFDYLTDPHALANIPAGEVIGRLPDGRPIKKLPPYRFTDPDPSIDPSVREALRSEVPERPGVILGKELAKSLNVLVGDEITLVSPMGELGPMGVLPRTRRFRVAAIFYSGMFDYDASHAYIELSEAQTFFALDGNISQIDVRVPDPEKLEAARAAVERAVASSRDPAKLPDVSPPPDGVRVRDWKEMNKNLFSALALERVATFMILCIAITVASFCIVCTLLLMVTEKGRQIAIMKALGASDGAIRRIFVLEGMIIGAIGTAFGVGIALAANTGLKWFGARLPPEVYYIDRLPINVDPVDYLFVAIAAMAICTLATLYPAHAASKLSPVDGLRYE